MIRRIVTKQNQRGKSYVASDTVTRNVEVPLPEISRDFAFYNIWTTDSMPVRYDDDDDPVAHAHVSTSPAKNGSLFRIVNYPPERPLMEKIKSMNEKELAEFERQVGVKINPSQKHPFMHMTDSIDFGIVLSGEIYLVLDKEETLLCAGDVVVQRGTNHAWSNRSDQDCKMAYVLLDGTAGNGQDATAKT